MDANISMDNLELLFLNGSCASLAKMFNEKCGYEIFHVYEFNKDDGVYENPDDDENGVLHTIVKIGEDKYLDVTGVHSSCDMIKEWYRARCATTRMTDIFLINNTLEFKIFSKGGKSYESPILNNDKLYYKFDKYFPKVNYDYDGGYPLSDVCNFLLNLYKVNK